MDDFDIRTLKRIDAQGGTAFPVNTDTMTCHGMSMRDYFAAQALAGLCANPGGPFQANAMNGWSIVNCTTDQVAQECYRLADSMLAGRLGEQQT